MSSLLHVPLRGHTEPLPGIGLHPIEFHDGKGYYYFTKDHSVSFDKRTLKCVKEHCSVTAQMEPVLGLLIDSETHSHAADLSYRDKCVLLHIIRERFLYETLPADVILQEVLTSFLGGSRNKDDERGEPCDDINEIVEEDQFSLKEEESEERLQTVDSEHEPQDIEHLGSSDGNSSFEVVVKEEPADESDNTLSEVQNHTKFRSSQKRKLQNIDNDVPDLQVPKKSKTLKSSLVRTAPEELNLPSSHADFQEVELNDPTADCLREPLLGKRKTCRLCPPRLKRKTKYPCQLCGQPICLECSKKVCTSCLGITLQRQTHKKETAWVE